MRRRGLSLIAGASFLFAGACGEPPPPVPPPAGLRAPELPPVPPLPEWPDDPPTPAKVALGTTLFFDVRLSGSGHSSCDSCHGRLTSFQDNLVTAIPDRSYPKDRPALGRNTLAFLNIVYAPVFRWDGSHTDLVDVMAFPFSEANMDLGIDVPAAQVKLRQRLTTDLPGYVAAFQGAYGVDLRTLDEKGVWRMAGRALAAFVRQAVSTNSPFDRWNAGDDSAMSASAVRGLAVFRGKGRCLGCHSGPFFTDFGFHNLSTSPPGPGGMRADEGRFLVTGKEADRGKFLTPTLRGVYDSSPYFHDGSNFGLGGVLKHLSSPAVTRDPNHDPAFDQPITLLDSDIDDLIDFLEALRGSEDSTRITPPPSYP